ncbi:unnamed protein product [Rhodiola kirilowii]
MAEGRSSLAQPCFPKYDGDNDHWSPLMENLLRSKDFWGVIETAISAEAADGLTAEQKKTQDDLKLKDLKAKNYLFASIDKTILKTISKKATTKDIWDSMMLKCQGNARVKKAQLNRLRRSFEVLMMKQGEPITDYFNRVMIIANEMRSCGEKLKDVKIVEKVLRTLTEKWNYIVCSIVESKDIDKLSVDELQSSLLVHEQKFNRDGDFEEDQVLKVSHEDARGYRQSQRGRGRSYNRGRGRYLFSRATSECFKCHKIGHFQHECPEWDKANFAKQDEEEDMLLMTYANELDSKREDAWYLDSGCSNHMCGDSSYFSTLDNTFKHKVKLGNNSNMLVNWRVSVKIKIRGINHTISDVYYVPELKNNLLSIGQLQEKNLAIVFNEGYCRIYYPSRGLIIETMMRVNRMFIAFADTNSDTPTR